MPVNAIDKITQGQSKSRHYITFQLVLAKSPADRHRGKTTYVEKPPKIFLKKSFWAVTGEVGLGCAKIGLLGFNRSVGFCLRMC
jgi:hypothetical protein